MKTIQLTGPFTDADIIKFVDLLRHIDTANPTGIFTVKIIDPNSCMENSERVLREALPPLPERTTNYARASYRDASYPERLCDYCGQPYRGPVTYCQLECALLASICSANAGDEII